MFGELTLADRRAKIDSRLETALESARGECLAPARTVIVEQDDRRYGQLVALVYNSVAETPDDSSILRAATAMELFRGYCRLREQLLGRLAGSESDSVTRTSNAALLASDYLHTAAYSTLSPLEDTDVRPCIGTLASVSERIIETLTDAPLESTPSPAEYCSFVDGTAGALGRGAAVIGATLADVDDRERRRFATLGRGASVRRRLRRVLDADADTDTIRLGSPPLDGQHRILRQHARRRLTEATEALRTLSSTTDVDSLGAFVEGSTPVESVRK